MNKGKGGSQKKYIQKNVSGQNVLSPHIMIIARLKSRNVQEMQLACGMGRSLYLGANKVEIRATSLLFDARTKLGSIANSSYFGLDRNE